MMLKAFFLFWLSMIDVAFVSALDSDCTAKCPDELVACKMASATELSWQCPAALGPLDACSHDDALCQLVVFVTFGQNNTKLNDVLRCFAQHNCTYQMRDVSALPDATGAQTNLTDLDYLNGTWWTVGATSFLDAIPCGSAIFQWDDAAGTWFNNETMQTGPDSYVHAYPQVNMTNGPGTYTTDYRTVGWAQLENFTVISKPSPYWMLVYYCGKDVLLGSYCGTIVFSRFRDFAGIPRWVNETFRAVYKRLNLGEQHGHTYDDILSIDSTDCISNSTPPEPMSWPDRFNTTFTASFGFAPDKVWDSVFSYDYPNERSRVAHHIREDSGLACSYLFAEGVARCISDKGPPRCCVDPSVPGYPTKPDLLHNFSAFEGSLCYGHDHTQTAVWGMYGLEYGVSLRDGSPVFLNSMDFDGVWNFTGPFVEVASFRPETFAIPEGCNDICNKTNNCFYGV